MLTSDKTPHTWARLAAKSAPNRRNTSDNRMEVIPQSVPQDQVEVAPTVNDMKFINAPLEKGGEHQDPIQQRRHDMTPQDEDANPADFTTCNDPPRSDNSGHRNDGTCR
jgi:hypothetical protein